MNICMYVGLFVLFTLTPRRSVDATVSSQDSDKTPQRVTIAHKCFSLLVLLFALTFRRRPASETSTKYVLCLSFNQHTSLHSLFGEGRPQRQVQSTFCASLSISIQDGHIVTRQPSRKHVLRLHALWFPSFHRNSSLPYFDTVV